MASQAQFANDASRRSSGRLNRSVDSDFEVWGASPVHLFDSFQVGAATGEGEGDSSLGLRARRSIAILDRNSLSLSPSHSQAQSLSPSQVGLHWHVTMSAAEFTWHTPWPAEQIGVHAEPGPTHSSHGLQ